MIGLRVTAEEITSQARGRVVFRVEREGRLHVLYRCRGGCLEGRRLLTLRRTFDVQDRGTRIEDAGREPVERIIRTWLAGGERVASMPVGPRTAVPAVACPGCGAWMEGREVMVEEDPTVLCGPACSGAVRADCRCSCGGERHGEDWAR